MSTKDQEIEDSINETFNIDPKANKQLLTRIKKGKRWLTINRLQWLQAKGLSTAYDHNRWTNNHNLYLELYDEAYKKGLVDVYQWELLNSWGIEDYMPTLRKIFKPSRFEEVLDN